MTYQHIAVRQVVGAVGAEISGVDLSQPLPKPVVNEIHAAWLAHQVVFFRGQSLTPATQAAFAENFGELDIYPFMKALNVSPALAAVVGSAPLARTEVVKKLWVYIKKNGLQDAKNRRMINADDKLKVVFGGKTQVSMFDMTKLVSKHLS